MADTSIRIQQPTPASQLILIFHGVGSNPQSMVPLATHMAKMFPKALVACIQSPNASFVPGGYEWFSVAGITEEGRQQRIDAAMPGFTACIAQWQTEAGVGPEATALIGFSQGAIMALESSKLASPPASRIVSIAGRFANLPDNGNYNGTIHFLHGKEDPVIPYQHTVMAAHHLRDLGVDMTAEILPFVQHAVPQDFIDMAAEKLSTHISHKVWKDAAAMPDQ
jgi:phospholipase/carboxylesterase